MSDEFLEPLDLNAGQDDEVMPEPELLTVSLFKQAIQDSAGNANDAILKDFAEFVLPNLMKQLSGATAKGGMFFERIDARRKVEGKDPVRRDNAADQSLLHIC